MFAGLQTALEASGARAATAVAIDSEPLREASSLSQPPSTPKIYPGCDFGALTARWFKEATLLDNDSRSPENDHPHATTTLGRSPYQHAIRQGAQALAFGFAHMPCRRGGGQ